MSVLYSGRDGPKGRFLLFNSIAFLFKDSQVILRYDADRKVIDMSQILYGKAVAAALGERLTQQIQSLKLQHINPLMAVVRVGGSPDAAAYEKNILRQCDRYGIGTRVHHLEEGAGQTALIDLIRNLNTDRDVNGIMVFMPLPDAFDEAAVRLAIHPDKDIDGINIQARRFLPATPRAVVEVLKYYGVPLTGSDALIINSSDVVGRPLAMMMLSEQSTITVGHAETRNLREKARQSEIVISAVGKPRLFDSGFFNERSIVIDVGINQDEEGQLCGDVDYEAVKDKVRAITPVPGGIGSVTTTVLMSQVVEACILQNRFVQ